MSERSKVTTGIANLGVGAAIAIPALLGQTPPSDLPPTTQRPPAATAPQTSTSMPYQTSLPNKGPNRVPTVGGTYATTVPPTTESYPIDKRPSPLPNIDIVVPKNPSKAGVPGTTVPPTVPEAPSDARPEAIGSYEEQSHKQEVTARIPGTNIAVGLENDNNGTLNTGQGDLIPNVLPNIVIGQTNHNGGTIGDGWLYDTVQTTTNTGRVRPEVVQVPGQPVEVTTEVTDITKYPIETPWERDFQASPELSTELHSAMEDCYSQIDARQRQGYALTTLQVGGLASGEDNVTNPGDPMANLDQSSEPNHNLANQRGLAGVATMSDVLKAHGADVSVLQFKDGQEIDPTDQELDQIIQYAMMLGEDPLTLAQDYNRARAEGLQPLMDKLFKGNRGVVCIASFSKLETTLLPGPSETRVVLVPVLVHGEKRIWRIEIPGEVLLLPLLYMGLRSLGMSGLGRSPKNPRSLFPDEAQRSSQLYDPPTQTPYPTSQASPPKEIGHTQESSQPYRPVPPPKIKIPSLPVQPPRYVGQPLRGPKEIGQAQSGYWQTPQKIKQPNVKTNMHNTGRAGHRSNTKPAHQGSRPDRSTQKAGGSRNGSR